ncbi:hypothetical protein LCGC14_3087910 [marine sediment metagenome]|uniref:Uncharacterized protein n=1 Tax=marine sediment metagenome TaxID=412755 RepID=A0A0F8YIX7_9ZZZZ
MPKKNKTDFLNLSVNVFKNKRNGQRTVILPRKILKEIPNRINIKIPVEYFKEVKGGSK